MFRKYNRSVFDDLDINANLNVSHFMIDEYNLDKQHNIFVLVGNGFDIAVTNKYGNGKPFGKSTSYQNFYDYIDDKRLVTKSNILFQQMTEDRKKGKKEWADFENTLLALYNKRNSVSALEECIDEFQNYFVTFLNEIVDADLLIKLNSAVQREALSDQSLSCFLNDSEFSSLKFPEKTGHYDLFYFVFANFNYTPLLDNYIFLDKGQFDPHKWKNADRNFQFCLNQKNPKTHNTSWSSYVVTEIIHPHGIQAVPRSILFGVDIPNIDKGRSKEKRLVKSYWARYDVMYSSYLEEAELFIIYGMSLGKSDGWWMDKIYDTILKRGAELIIYMYGIYSEEQVKDMFINACVRHSSDSDKNKQTVKAAIEVVSFTENNTWFLGFAKLNSGGR